MSKKTTKQEYDERLTVQSGSFRIFRPGQGEMNLRDTGLPGAQPPPIPPRDNKKRG